MTKAIGVEFELNGGVDFGERRGCMRVTLNSTVALALGVTFWYFLEIYKARFVLTLHIKLLFAAISKIIAQPSFFFLFLAENKHSQ